VVRTADERRPEELLDAIVDHLTSHGVSELSLRPLAKAVRSSPRVLLYYFGSKEELVARALERMRERQRATYATLSALPAMKTATRDSPAAACRAIWRHMSAQDSEPAFRLFFDAYALALRHPRRLADFLRSSVEDWLAFIAASLRRTGCPESEARAFATIVLAGFRGFMLDYCATRDRKRIDRAVDLWLKSLDVIPMQRERRS
jgi:AcrR family transcriptional regulator